MKTAEQISYNMRRVRNKDSAIEIILRQELWSRNMRYRKNVTSIFGKPDIAFPGKKIAVFCDSEFWHGFDWENRKKDIKSHQEFWIPKIERTIRRDIEVTDRLQADGWIVIRFWGKEIKRNVKGCADIIQQAWEERK